MTTFSDEHCVGKNIFCIFLLSLLLINYSLLKCEIIKQIYCTCIWNEINIVQLPSKENAIYNVFQQLTKCDLLLQFMYLKCLKQATYLLLTNSKAPMKAKILQTKKYEIWNFNFILLPPQQRLSFLHTKLNNRWRNFSMISTY